MAFSLAQEVASELAEASTPFVPKQACGLLSVYAVKSRTLEQGDRLLKRR